jgi:hypothetical protein
MKSFSKIISLSAAALTILTLGVSSFAASISFTDLATIPEADKIQSLSEKGIVNGIGNQLFAPAKPLTAAQGIQLIVKALDLNLDTVRFIKEPKATDYFAKADNDAWYANTLITASVNGMELPADLDPNAKWTKEEFTYQLVTAMEKKANLPKMKIISTAIADEDQMTASYSGAIQRSLLYSLTALDADGKFNPKAEITRAEAAAEIYNALAYLEAHQPATEQPVVTE